MHICIQEQQTRAQCSITLSSSREQPSRPLKTSALCHYFRVIVHKVKSAWLKDGQKSRPQMSWWWSIDDDPKRSHFTQLKIKQLKWQRTQEAGKPFHSLHLQLFTVKTLSKMQVKEFYFHCMVISCPWNLLYTSVLYFVSRARYTGKRDHSNEAVPNTLLLFWWKMYLCARNRCLRATSMPGQCQSAAILVVQKKNTQRKCTAMIE